MKLQRNCNFCRSVQFEDIRHVQDYTNQFRALVVETKKRLTFVTLIASFLATMTNIATVCGKGVETVKSLHVKLTDLSKTFAEIDTLASEANHYIDDYAEKIVNKRELQARWKNSLGCQESDRCVTKMQIMRDTVTEIRNSFIQHRKLKSLSCSEEQMHNYDKRKLCKLYDDSRRLVDRHCLKNEQEIFSKAVRQYDLIDGMVGNKVRRIEAQILTATEKLNSFHPQLDMIQAALEQQIFRISDPSLAKTASPAAHKESRESKMQKEPLTNGTSSPPNISTALLLKLQEEMSGLREVMETNHSLMLQLDTEVLCI